MRLNVPIAENGRMSLPAPVRKRLGLGKGGGMLLLEETADGIVLRTKEQAVARAQAFSDALLRGQEDTATVDHFLAERREWTDRS